MLKNVSLKNWNGGKNYESQYEGLLLDFVYYRNYNVILYAEKCKCLMSRSTCC
jgi:hypothetical protein